MADKAVNLTDAILALQFTVGKPRQPVSIQVGYKPNLR